MLAMLLPVAVKLIERLFPDKEKQDEAKAEMLTIMASSEKALWEGKSNVIVAEAQGESWLQRNWRPIAMMVFLSVVVNNFIIAPYIQVLFGIVIPVPPIGDAMWGLLAVGIGGYIGGRSFEKVQQIKHQGINKEIFLKTLEAELGNLKSDDHAALSKAFEKSAE